MNNDLVEKFKDYLCCLFSPFFGEAKIKGVVIVLSIDLKGFNAKKFFNALDSIL